jgi:hypothetical protein
MDPVLGDRADHFTSMLEELAEQILPPIGRSSSDRVERELMAATFVGATMNLFVAITSGRIKAPRARVLDFTVDLVERFARA